jgi:hypothetical protein
MMMPIIRKAGERLHAGHGRRHSMVDERRNGAPRDAASLLLRCVGLGKVAQEH